MSSIADALELLIKQIISNIDTLTLRRIRTRARGDLTIDNGAGASIVLAGDKVLINGLSGRGSNNVFDIIYLGKDKKCWICRDPSSGDMVFHTPVTKGFIFEDAHLSALFATDAVQCVSTFEDDNYGTSTAMTVSAYPSEGFWCNSYLQFNVGTSEDIPTSVTLRLYVTYQNGGANDVSTISLTKLAMTFDHSTVTWRTAPGGWMTSVITGQNISISNSAKWVEIDVTSLYNDADHPNEGGIFGLILKCTDGAELTCSSGVGAYPPQLVVI